MSRMQRDKGRKGEAEVAEVYRRHAFAVRGLEGAGDHLVVCGESSGLVLHSEVKRAETARLWLWWEQTSAEAPAGTVPVLHLRRNRSPWLAVLELERLAAILHRLEELEARNVRLEELKAGG